MRRVVAAVLLVVLGVGWPPPAAAGSLSIPPAYFRFDLPKPVLISSVPPTYRTATFSGPRTDGRDMVWSVDGRVMLASLDTRAVRVLGEGAWPDVSTGIVAWLAGDQSCIQSTPGCGTALLALDLATGQVVEIASGTAILEPPVIWNGNIYWVAWAAGGPATLFVRDALARSPAKALIPRLDPDIRRATASGNVGRPQPLVDGDVFVWARARDIVAISTGGQQWIVADLGRPIGGDDFVAGGDVVVTVNGDRTASVVNLRTGDRKDLGSRVGRVSLPQTDGKIVAWYGDVVYDIAADTVYPTAAPWVLPSHVRNGTLTWVAVSGGSTKYPAYTLSAARVDALLAAAPRPNTPGAFPETGHALAPPFATYWQRHGGLPAFGFPLTEPFDEPNLDANGRPTAWHRVQYLERQRLEHHPDLAGTPYEVLLGRLGAEEATQRGLASHWGFQPVAQDAQHPANCRFILETGHRLCGEFRGYWQSGGLDLGDLGISHRESLALYGFPISEEFVDEQTGLVTQYFERARFEWHPDNAAPYRVLLGRLSAERLVSWGWRKE